MLSKTHEHKTSKNCNQTAKDINKLNKVLILVGLFMILEIWGHWASNTLSLLADSVHLFVDILGFLISLLALKFTQRKSDKKMNFGYGRIEIIGAMFSIFLIWIAVFYLIIESYKKYKHPKEIDEKIFVLISIIGFGVNLACVYLLHENDSAHINCAKNLNIRAAYVHVLGDVIQSFGVLLAGTITYFYPKLIFVDIFCTLFFSVLVLCTTSIILKDGLLILSESTPKHIKEEDIKQEILKIKFVKEVVDMKIWCISAYQMSVNVTLMVTDVYIKDYERVLDECKRILKGMYLFEFINVQIETYGTILEKNVLPKGVVSERLKYLQDY